MTHALRATELPPELAHLPGEIARWMDAVLADEGNVEDVSARRRAQLENRGRIQRRIMQLDTTLELRGLVDRRGRLRVAWLERLESLIAAALRIDQALGLERKGKKPASVAAWLDDRERRAGA